MGEIRDKFSPINYLLRLRAELYFRTEIPTYQLITLFQISSVWTVISVKAWVKYFLFMHAKEVLAHSPQATTTTKTVVKNAVKSSDPAWISLKNAVKVKRHSCQKNLLKWDKIEVPNRKSKHSQEQMIFFVWHSLNCCSIKAQKCKGKKHI